MVENKACLLATSPLSLALLREVRAAWPLIESAAEWGTSSLRMKDEKMVRFGRNRGSCSFAPRVAPRGSRFLRLFPLVDYPSGERSDTKNARGEKALL